MASDRMTRGSGPHNRLGPAAIQPHTLPYTLRSTGFPARVMAFRIGLSTDLRRFPGAHNHENLGAALRDRRAVITTIVGNGY